MAAVQTVSVYSLLRENVGIRAETENERKSERKRVREEAEREAMASFSGSLSFQSCRRLVADRGAVGWAIQKVASVVSGIISSVAAGVWTESQRGEGGASFLAAACHHQSNRPNMLPTRNVTS